MKLQRALRLAFWSLLDLSEHDGGQTCGCDPKSDNMCEYHESDFRKWTARNAIDICWQRALTSPVIVLTEPPSDVE